jgi:curved DNA-binding protein
MKFKDYYEVMGVGRKATQDEIKRAYRKLARKYHPDVSSEKDAEARFKEVGEAYEVLKDPEKRAAYDQLGSQWKAGQDFRPPPNWDAGFEFSEAGRGRAEDFGFSDFFESLYGRQHAQQDGSRGGRQAGLHLRGQDHHAKVLVELEDSFNGASRQISLRTPELTPDGHVVTRDRTLNVRIEGHPPGQQIRLAGQRHGHRRRGCRGPASKWSSKPIRVFVWMALTSISTCRWRPGKRRWAPRWRLRLRWATWTSKSPRVRRRTGNCASRAAACQGNHRVICMSC